MLDFLRKLFLAALVILVLIGGGVGYVVHNMFIYANPQTARIKIPKGASLKLIAYKLEAEHVIHNRFVFELYARVSKKSAKLKAGEYEFAQGRTLEQIIDQIVKGNVILYKLTIPEGYSIKDVCGVFYKQNLTTLLECQRLVRQVDLLKDKTPQSHTLEGYLFPETYLYDSESTAENIIKQMLDTFYAKAGENLVKQAGSQGLTLNAWVTLASVIEKETGQAGERSLIASVFLNRLKIDMPLQSDPTVIYGIANFNGNLTRVDLQTDSPYNTYTRKGLPYGPICSPGLDALKAVLAPAKSDYLYFVAKGDGTHYFSKTLEEHNQAVQKYQLLQ